MKIYIKNNKASGPTALINQVMDTSITYPNGTHQICGYIYHRGTTTRNSFGGENGWNLYYVEAMEGYIAVQNGRRGVRLGRYDGRDIFVEFRRITAPALRLPNGELLPPETEESNPVIWIREYPESAEQVRDILDLLPFHQPGGPGSTLEQVDAEDVYLREWCSRFAFDCPREYREVVADVGDGDMHALYRALRLVHYEPEELAHDPFIREAFPECSAGADNSPADSA